MDVDSSSSLSTGEEEETSKGPKRKKTKSLSEFPPIFAN
jgi:hypothetical protein